MIFDFFVITVKTSYEDSSIKLSSLNAQKKQFLLIYYE